MKLYNLRCTLTLIFLLGFLTCIGIVLRVITNGMVNEPEGKAALIKSVCLVYTFHLGVILAAWFNPLSARKGYSPKAKGRKHIDIFPVFLAIAGVVIWNLFSIFPLTLFFNQNQDTWLNVVNLLTTVTKASGAIFATTVVTGFFSEGMAKPKTPR